MSETIHDAAISRARAYFVQEFGEPAPDARLLYVHAPGRSEISGNHTDHEGGRVIAGALDVAVEGIAVANGTNTIRIADEGFPPFEITLDDLSVQTEEREGSASLLRGMAAQLADTGREPTGFDFAFICTVPSGGGLSSSAAVEAAYGRAMEALWEGREISPIELAKMSQFAENEYFGKPCGLMDQAAVCLGGLAYMDFEEATQPACAKLDFDFDKAGYGLVLVKVGSDHADLTDEYAAIPQEMQAVAAEFGKKRLCEVDPHDFDARVAELRQKLGDRAVLRAIHYFYEVGLVDKRWDALQAGDIDRFLALTRESGASSAMFLQNVTVAGSDVRSQHTMVALGLAERILAGRGATRIHGGGFGGSIQCFVPTELVDEFIQRMNAWLGEGFARHYAIAQEGAFAQWL
ncbi:galactokinase [Collinsella sp. AGMB00827]|uniref:Galactokinase n=1 Tax=Collinsella ureilytica TaxID=2869515 RepID=A0ABS7MM22_9ACTN|nr:galactokinase family protein [Collinsella urealyticum]MBY4797465.1 galactokinase [Collinsella urealyticum]